MMTKRTKLVGTISLVITLVSVALFVAFVHFFIVLKEQYTESMIAVAQARVNEKEMATLKKLVDGTQDERMELEGYILPHDENKVVDFLSLLNTLGKEQGLELLTPSVQVTDTEEFFETLEVRVEVVGSYTRIVHMLKLLEQLPYQSTVSTVAIRRDDGSRRDGGGAPGAPFDEWNGSFTLHVTKHIEP